MNDFQMYEEGRKEAQNEQCNISIVRQRALDWWETLNHYKQNWLAGQYCTQDALSFRYEQDKIEYIYKLVHGLD